MGARGRSTTSEIVSANRNGSRRMLLMMSGRGQVKLRLVPVVHAPFRATMSFKFPPACILLASQHPIFTRHVGVGRDEPKSITLFINPSPTIQLHSCFYSCHTSILNTSCDFIIFYALYTCFFFGLRYPLLFNLLLVPFVTMSSQSTLSQCENFVSVSEDPDLVESDFPFSAFIYFPLSIIWKSIVKHIWWNIPDCVHFTDG